MQTVRRSLLSLLGFTFALMSLPSFAQVVVATVPVGDGPGAIAVNPVTNKTYAVNLCGNDATCQSKGTVTVIDGATLATQAVAVGYQPYSLAVNSVTNKIYVANVCGNDSTCQSQGTVTVIDGATLSTATVAVGYQPFFIAVNEVTNKIYAVNQCGVSHPDLSCSSNDPPGSVTVIDGATTSTTTVTLGVFPSGVAVNPVTNKIYVVNSGGDEPCCTLNGTLAVIDGVTLSTQSVPVDMLPELVAVNPTINKIYVANECSSLGCAHNGTVTVVDGDRLSTQTVNTGYKSRLIAVNPATNKIYVGNRCADSSCAAKPTATVINGLTLTTANVPICNASTDHPTDVEVNTVANAIYVTCGGSTGHVVTAIDGPTNGTNNIAVGNRPTAAAVNAPTDRVYVANYTDNTVSVIAGINTGPLQFIPITPCRLVDTRTDFGGTTIQAGHKEDFPVPTLGGCNIPTSAAAYSFNVTIVPPPGGIVGFLTVWPAGEGMPNVSTVNSWDGRFKANAAIVPAGAGGAVSVYSSGTTDLVLDIAGYFEPATGSTLAFYPLAPCRVADTRWQTGDLGGPYLHIRQERHMPVLESHCGIPDTAQAYSFNFTVVPRSGPVWVFSAWPDGHSQPDTSTLNAPTGTVVANAALMPAGTNGAIDVWASNDADMVIDVNGYFAPPGEGGMSLHAMTPCRVLDTRLVGSEQPFTGMLPYPVKPSDPPCQVPDAAQAFVFNATIVPHSVPVWLLTLWPDLLQIPNASTLNAWDGAVTSNMAIVPAGTDGSIDAYAAGLTQLILDISSYFAP